MLVRKEGERIWTEGGRDGRKMKYVPGDQPVKKRRLRRNIVVGQVAEEKRRGGGRGELDADSNGANSRGNSKCGKFDTCQFRMRS